MQVGLGLTDGEGVESDITGLIDIERHCGCYKRLIDCLVYFISCESKDGLSDWLHCRLAKGVGKQERGAKQVLGKCGIGERVLREQWKIQREVPTSLRAREPLD